MTFGGTVKKGCQMRFAFDSPAVFHGKCAVAELVVQENAGVFVEHGNTSGNRNGKCKMQKVGIDD